MIHFDEEKHLQKLQQFREQEGEDVADMLATRFSLPYVNLANVTINVNALQLVSEEDAKKFKLAPFDIRNREVAVAVMSPTREDTKHVIDELQSKGYTVNVYVASQKSLEKAWTRYVDITIATESTRGLLTISGDEIARILKDVKSPQAITELIDHTISLRKSRQITSIVEIIIAGAIALDASDVHTEPGEHDVGLRLRIDGILTPIVDFDVKTYQLLLSRIKLLSGMKLNIRDESQEGRFSIKINDIEIEIRSSILPGAYGEAIVLRILNPDAIKVSLEELGLEPYLLDIVRKQVEKPSGLILNTGPTGSGKTTTLYAFLRYLHKPNIKIITIEDPVEYHLDGIVQTQVEEKKHYTFVEGLNASLRQDPDVIMVGEIRDDETADTAFQASLTGHIVFSTLHTRGAAGTFARLLDLGVNPHSFGSAMNMIMAQRLIRVLCPETKVEVPIDGPEKALIERIVSGSSNQEVFAPYLPLKTMYKAGKGEGCPLGYKGRVAVFEAIIMTPKVAEVLKREGSEEEIQEAARDQKILTMAEDGILKVLKGETDLEELQRVIDLSR